MDNPERVYVADGITVEWRPSLCIHCEDCWRGLPQVFNMNARPWVNIDGAPAAAIEEQVNKCPSAALALGPVRLVGNVLRLTTDEFCKVKDIMDGCSIEALSFTSDLERCKAVCAVVGIHPSVMLRKTWVLRVVPDLFKLDDLSR